MHELLLYFMNGKIWRVIDVDSWPDGSGWIQYFRFVIEMDLTKPIAGGRMIMG